MLSLRPKASWITTTPGYGPRSCEVRARRGRAAGLARTAHPAISRTASAPSSAKNGCHGFHLFLLQAGRDSTPVPERRETPVQLPERGRLVARCRAGESGAGIQQVRLAADGHLQWVALFDQVLLLLVGQPHPELPTAEPQREGMFLPATRQGGVERQTAIEVAHAEPEDECRPHPGPLRWGRPPPSRPAAREREGAAPRQCTTRPRSVDRLYRGLYTRAPAGQHGSPGRPGRTRHS